MLIYLEIFTVINVLAITINFTVMCVTREKKNYTHKHSNQCICYCNSYGNILFAF